MERFLNQPGFMHASRLCAIFAVGALVAVSSINPAARAQNPASSAKPVTALFLSDIHFEPFSDPGKVAKLVASPASEWRSILTAPPSADQADAFAKLQQTCHARGEDATSALYESSLAAMKADAPGARFITVSGDLVAHVFDCKYHALIPAGTEDEYSALVTKTIEYVVLRLRETYPGIPLYVALGNNDSGCGDYKLDPQSEFLGSTGRAITALLPAADRAAAQQSFAAGGNFSALLPEPIAHTRLLVLDDLFLSRRYQSCAGKPDSAPAQNQLAWLKQQLDVARAAKDHVWVMAHIPPGVDPVSTAMHMRNVCSGQSPEVFLSSDDLPALLAQYSDVIQLALFGHTHMDEMRVIGNGAGKPVAAKLVASISPINGNSPSFTVASVDPATATLLDYRVFAASGSTGVNTVWHEEYGFDKAYGVREFSSATIGKLVTGFKADQAAESATSQQYIRSYFGRDESTRLKPFWAQYVCAVSGVTTASYHSCLCGAAQ